MYRDNTKVIKIGDRVIGGGNPILIQSMTNTKTEDVEATVAQILRLEEAGCEIIRCTVPTMEAALALKEIKKRIHIPLVADIHFDYKMAIAAMENGADKIRINPGNIGSIDRIKAVVDCAKERNIPIRIGVNSGSLEKELVEKYNGVTASDERAGAYIGITLRFDAYYKDVLNIYQLFEIVYNNLLDTIFEKNGEAIKYKISKFEAADSNLNEIKKKVVNLIQLSATAKDFTALNDSFFNNCGIFKYYC